MSWRSLLVAVGVSLAFPVAPAPAADPPKPKGESVKVEVEGLLGGLSRAEGGGPVGATVLTGGGEFVLDYGQSKKAEEELTRLADHYLKPGSSTIVLPRVSVRGRLEFRPKKVLAEKGGLKDGPPTWVLVVDSLSVTERFGGLDKSPPTGPPPAVGELIDFSRFPETKSAGVLKGMSQANAVAALKAEGFQPYTDASVSDQWERFRKPWQGGYHWVNLRFGGEAVAEVGEFWNDP